MNCLYCMPTVLYFFLYEGVKLTPTTEEPHIICLNNTYRNSNIISVGMRELDLLLREDSDLYKTMNEKFKIFELLKLILQEHVLLEYQRCEENLKRIILTEYTHNERAKLNEVCDFLSPLDDLFCEFSQFIDDNLQIKKLLWRDDKRYKFRLYSIPFTDKPYYDGFLQFKKILNQVISAETPTGLEDTKTSPINILCDHLVSKDDFEAVELLRSNYEEERSTLETRKTMDVRELRFDSEIEGNVIRARELREQEEAQEALLYEQIDNEVNNVILAEIERVVDETSQSNASTESDETSFGSAQESFFLEQLESVINDAILAEIELNRVEEQTPQSDMRAIFNIMALSPTHGGGLTPFEFDIKIGILFDSIEEENTNPQSGYNLRIKYLI